MPMIVCDSDFLINTTSRPLPELAEFLESSGFEFVTLPKIVEELEGLALSKKPATAKKAKTALRSIEAGKVKIIHQAIFSSTKKTDADAVLLHYAAKNTDKERIVIATLDHSLLSVLERMRLPYLTLRKDRPHFRSF